MKKHVFLIEILRTVSRSRKRFFSIAIITALGVTMFTGLKAACIDLRYSADQFFEQQKLFDIRVVSTMGLTEEDVKALALAEGVETAVGSYSETVSFQADGARQNAELTVLGEDGINEPYLLQGTMPMHSGELAVTPEFLETSGSRLGDKLIVEEETAEGETANFLCTEYTITASVRDPRDVSSHTGPAAFRSNGAGADFTFFVTDADVRSDIYTAVYLLAEGAGKLNCFSDAYKALTAQVMEGIEKDIRGVREQSRYESLMEQSLAYSGAEGMERPKWYVQDRTVLEGYSSIESDTASIEAVGTAFPIVFFVVAVLISLTTVTRMVEEERGLIGIYKALGFRNAAIYAKYLLYALSACLLGGAAGDLCGFILLPKFVWVIFQRLYVLPSYTLRFDLLYGLGGISLFAGGIVGAAVLACRNELVQMPAVLMRPRTPGNGSRVVLEYVPFIWKRLKFLNKVTMRNLFRYKKRMFMTIAGIAGCTALVLCGFAIKDSVTDLMPKQYEHIYRYDLMAVVNERDSARTIENLIKEPNIADTLPVRIESVALKNEEGGEEKVQLIVVPQGSTLENYIRLEDLQGEVRGLEETGVLVTQNAARMLGLAAGDKVFVQNADWMQAETGAAGIVQNYLGNNIYMTQGLYEELFGAFEANGFLAHLTESCIDQPAFAAELEQDGAVLSAVSTAALRRDFETSFSLINAVVYLITAMAAGLAFVVLFTLSATNISERSRELATIKVLGFYDKEVHLYVNKETLILTSIGILLGLPAGRVLGGALTYVLNMPSVHFAVSVHIFSYAAAAVISFCFAVVVSWMTNKTLNHIDMIEALKSVE